MYTQINLGRVISILSIACVLILTHAATAEAQPAQEVENLRQQMMILQNKLAQLDNDNPIGDSSSRVKSVGSHRAKPKPAVVDEDEMLIRLYDLSDIFVVSPNYPAHTPDDIDTTGRLFANSRAHQRSGSGGGGLGAGGGIGGGGMGGGGGGGVFSFPPSFSPTATRTQEPASSGLQSAQVSLNQLVTAIQETVSPDMWGDHEDEAKIQFLGNTLLITATNDMHTQINNLLNLFRSHWGKLRTVSIQTYWVRAEEGQAKSLLNGEHQEAVGAGVVEPERWKEFFESAELENRLAYSATLTGHNNQTLHALSGRQKQLIVGAIPIESTEIRDRFNDENDNSETLQSSGPIGFQPIRQTIHNGAAIQVTPLATRGGNFVVLDLHAKVNELVKPEEGSDQPSAFVFLKGGEKAEVKFDSTEYIAYRMSTTIRCPKEQIVLAGSMTFDSNSDIEQPNLYLFVKATVHTIKEDKSDWTDESAVVGSKPAK